MGEVFLKLLNMSITAGWLVLAVLVVRMLLQEKAPKALFPVLWGLVAVRLVCPISIESSFGLFPEMTVFDSAKETYNAVKTEKEEADTSKLSEVSNTVHKDTLAQVPEGSEPQGVTIVLDPAAIGQEFSEPQVSEKNVFGENAEQTKQPVESNEEATSTFENKQDSDAINGHINSLTAEKAGFTNEKLKNALSTVNSQATLQRVLPIVSIIWLVGAVSMLFYMGYSYLRVLNGVKESVPISKNVLIGDRIDSPFVLGMLRPRIYLPSDLPAEDRAFVLAHEKAHMKRFDHIWKPFGFLLLAVYWFHPLFWVAYLFLCRDIEYACDEKVIKDLAITEKKQYSNALINCSVPRQGLTVCPIAFGETDVKNRVKSVLRYKKPKLWIVVLSVILCFGMAGCFLTTQKAKETELPTITKEPEAEATNTPNAPETLETKTQENTSESSVTNTQENAVKAEKPEDSAFLTVIENAKYQIYVQDSYAAYLDQNGKLTILYIDSDTKDTVKYIDFSKSYQALADDPNCIIPIDENGVPHPAYEMNSKEMGEYVSELLAEVAAAGGCYGTGGIQPRIAEDFEKMTGAVQIFSTYPYKTYRVLFEDGTVQDDSFWITDTKIVQDAVEIAYGKSALIGRKADGTLIIPDIETNKELQKTYADWTGKFRQISSGTRLVGVREDGTVITENVALNYIIQKDGWNNIVKAALGERMIAGLKADGTVVVACENRLDEAMFDVANWKNIVTIAATGNVLMGVDADGTVYITGSISDLPLITKRTEYQSGIAELNIAGETVSVPEQNVTINDELGIGIAFVHQYAFSHTSHYNIYRSEDNGATWFMAAEDFTATAGDIARILIPEPETIVCYFALSGVTVQSSCYVSEDGGRTWSAPPQSSKPNNDLLNAKEGTSVLFGSYEQDGNLLNGKEVLEWIVQEKKDNKLQLVSKYFLETMPYEMEGSVIDTGTTNSKLRDWLNDSFYTDVFTDEERAAIVKEGNDLAYIFNTEDLENGFTEKSQTFLQGDVRVTIPTAYAVMNTEWTPVSAEWWLNPDTTIEGMVTVRPVVWVDTEKLIQ